MEEIIDMFKNHFPFSFLYFVPILALLSPFGSPTPASAAQEFSVFRLQQFDLHGTSYGTRGAAINVEARPVTAKTVTRRCIITRIADISAGKVRELATLNAGGLLLLLPHNLSSLSAEQKEHVMLLEQEITLTETSLPIYFATETPELIQMYENVQASDSGDSAGTAAEALFHTAFANAIQLVVGSAPAALQDFQIHSLQGMLPGHGIVDDLPTIVLTAHYDSYGASPSLSEGADSNGSGVVALFEMMRIFSRLYSSSRTHAKYNLVFLLSGGGKFNYQGTKRWIEDNQDNPESNMLNRVAFVMCLDTIGSGDELYLHVSKPPREDSSAGKFFRLLTDDAARLGLTVKQNHKKINLREDVLGWEHERFSIRRLQGFTVSRLASHKDPARSTILDSARDVNVGALTRNTQVMASALASFLFGLETKDVDVFSGSMGVSEALVGGWLEYMTQQPRAAQLITADAYVLRGMRQYMQRHLRDVATSSVAAEKKDPDFMFYSGHEATMTAYIVKPAVFDLFLGLLIVAYLNAIYFAVLKFPQVYSLLARPPKSKAMTNGKSHSKYD